MATNACGISDFAKGDMKKLLQERTRLMHKNPLTEPIIEEYGVIIANIDKINICEPGKGGNGGKSRKPRKKTARMMFIGHCMRKPENGGLGKDMATCSTDWKGLTDVEKAEFTPKEEPPAAPAPAPEAKAEKPKLPPAQT